jgi:hypothetical protein
LGRTAIKSINRTAAQSLDDEPGLAHPLQLCGGQGTIGSGNLDKHIHTKWEFQHDGSTRATPSESGEFVARPKRLLEWLAATGKASRLFLLVSTSHGNMLLCQRHVSRYGRWNAGHG